jgi:hypothetical protein
MLSEISAHTILTASIAGAGLSLAVYSLFVPIAEKVFNKRLELYERKKVEFDKLKEKLSEESSEKDFERLKALGMEIKEMKGLPRYLNWSASAFILYTVTAIIDLLCITDQSYYLILQNFVEPFFFISTLFLFIAGVMAVRDIRGTMMNEYEKVKAGKKEVMTVTKTLTSKFKINAKPKEKKED